jgi:prephenate dehydrogenase
MKIENKKILIIGLGHIGGSILKKLNEDILYKENEGYLFGIEKSEKVKNDIINSQIKIKFVDNISDVFGKVDLIVFCVPQKDVISYLDDLNLSGTKIILTDTCSVKSDLIKKVVDKKINNFIFSHPIAGTEHQGFHSANGKIFENSVVLISPKNESNSSMHNVVKGFWQDNIGSSIRILDDAMHDISLSMTSHFPHLLSFILSKIVTDNYDKSSFIMTNSLKDMIRIANSDPKLWAQILNENKKNIIELIDIFQSEIESVKEVLISSNSDVKKTEDLLEESQWHDENFKSK